MWLMGKASITHEPALYKGPPLSLQSKYPPSKGETPLLNNQFSSHKICQLPKLSCSRLLD